MIEYLEDSYEQGWGEVFKKNLFKEDWFWEDDSLKIDLYKKIFKKTREEKILGFFTKILYKNLFKDFWNQS